MAVGSAKRSKKRGRKPIAGRQNQTGITGRANLVVSERFPIESAGSFPRVPVGNLMKVKDWLKLVMPSCKTMVRPTVQTAIWALDDLGEALAMLKKRDERIKELETRVEELKNDIDNVLRIE
jgi:hypothetical protein